MKSGQSEAYFQSPLPPIETQICATVLRHLASGTVPSSKHTATPTTPTTLERKDESIETKPTANHHPHHHHHHQKQEQEQEQEQSLTIALSILLDATSTGPDPTEIQSLGWAYGMGDGSGALGDWDGCHYLPGSIGDTLRGLQEDVVEDLLKLAAAGDDDNGDDDGIDVVMGPWWRNDQPLHYSPSNDGDGDRGTEEVRRRTNHDSPPATRFCTVGSLPPWMVAYGTPTSGNNNNRDDVMLWNAPFAGICVPSSCTARSLYQLFAMGWDDSNSNEIETEDSGASSSGETFVEELLNLTLSNLIMADYDATLLTSSSSSSSKGEGIMTNGTNNTTSIKLASKRYRYISSLAQSIGAARQFQSGVLCEGETGSAVLDQGVRDWGYYGTIGLLGVLLSCVVFGTTSSSWSKRNGHGLSRKTTTPDGESDNDTDGCVGGGSNGQWYNTSGGGGHLHNKGNTIDGSGGEYKPLSTLNNKLNYGSNSNTYGDEEQKTICYKIPLFTANWNATQTTATVEIVSLLNEPSSPQAYFSHGRLCAMKRMHDLFGCFDAGQSFYEITRITHDELSTISGISVSSNIDATNKRTKISHSSELVRTNTTSTAATAPTTTTTDDEEVTESVSSSQCINGLRSISMLWIILAHTMVCHSNIGYTNPAAVFPPTGVMASRFGSFILSARYAVDTFFFIGGYLVMSGLLKKLDPALQQQQQYQQDKGSSGCDITTTTTSTTNTATEENVMVALWVERLYRWGILSRHHVVNGEYSRRLFITKKKNVSAKQSNGLMWMFPFLLHRIMRILPTYGVVLLLWWKVAITLGDGPFWPRWVSFTEKCDEHAWTNILFVNNLVPWYQPLGERDNLY